MLFKFERIAEMFDTGNGILSKTLWLALPAFVVDHIYPVLCRTSSPLVDFPPRPSTQTCQGKITDAPTGAKY
ncbi:hypothetical protein Nepgr_004400 [Nepenthes gracilis]|uniref:Uncharacterized protein n=1 Tax=Nepenthes gracilis TaxID=150966 RepID=A0AAD3S1D1_NEPGR|nr:hypothetical protein Nepgr_004400 [Nepenthes gracilis]